jgi:phosphatidyl-myo-inositol dimannoside synthase
VCVIVPPAVNANHSSVFGLGDIGGRDRLAPIGNSIQCLVCLSVGLLETVLHVLCLVSDAFGGRGGIAQYNRDFLSALAETGLFSSITVLPRHVPDPAEVPDGIIKQARVRPGRLAYALAAERTAMFQRVDLVFCGHLFMAPLAAMIARLKGAKLIVQMHGIEAWPRPSRFQRAAVESADLVLCVSRYTRAAVLAWAAMPPERVLVMPNTVGQAFTPGDGAAMRAALGLEGKRVLLTVGRMDSRERYKGHDLVIGAISEVVVQGHDVAYVVIGEGDDRSRLEALARETGIAERVRFLGTVGRHCLAEAYRMADLFVMPSTEEGFGIVFLEAMASGTLALGLGGGGANDPLADGDLGIVTRVDSLARDIAAALAKRKPDPYLLSSNLNARFGRQAFVSGARSVIHRLRESALRDGGSTVLGCRMR